MYKEKMKILNHKKREVKRILNTLHIKVYRKEEKNFTAVHLF